MPGRLIGAVISMTLCALPALAEGPGATQAAAEKQVATATMRLPSGWDGTSCHSDGDCRSHHCADNWDGSRFCARADLSCGFAGTSGVRPGFATSNAGTTYTCQAGGEWASLVSNRYAARKASPKPEAKQTVAVLKREPNTTPAEQSDMKTAADAGKPWSWSENAKLSPPPTPYLPRPGTPVPPPPSYPQRPNPNMAALTRPSAAYPQPLVQPTFQIRFW